MARPSQTLCPEPRENPDIQLVSLNPWAFGLIMCSLLWDLRVHNGLRRHHLVWAGHGARGTGGSCVCLGEAAPSWQAVRSWGLPGQSAALAVSPRMVYDHFLSRHLIRLMNLKHPVYIRKSLISLSNPWVTQSIFQFPEAIGFSY